MSIAKIATVALAGALLCASAAAHASVILSFGQAVNGPTVTATQNAAHTATEITGTNIPVIISQFLGGGAPIDASLTFLLDSNGVATVSPTGVFSQPFTGSFSFTSGINDTGINYLSAVFTDFVFGTVAGSSLTLSSSEPPGHDTFTSDILNAATFTLPRALSLAFADVTPPTTLSGGTLLPFASSVSGTISSNITAIPLPEPGSLTVLGAGLFAIGLMRVRFRRARARRAN